MDTKSATSRRNLRIPEVAVRVLTKHRANQKRERLAVGEKWIDSGLVFTSTIGTALDERNVRRDFDAILKAAKLPHIRIHDLRHTCASLLLAQGVHPRVAMEILGHSQISITLDLYSHVIPVLQTDAADRIDLALRG